jgi:hypothetical protein
LFCRKDVADADAERSCFHARGGADGGAASAPAHVAAAIARKRVLRPLCPIFCALPLRHFDRNRALFVAGDERFDIRIVERARAQRNRWKIVYVAVRGGAPAAWIDTDITAASRERHVPPLVLTATGATDALMLRWRPQTRPALSW